MVFRPSFLEEVAWNSQCRNSEVYLVPYPYLVPYVVTYQTLAKLSDVNYFRKTLCLGCFTGFLIQPLGLLTFLKKHVEYRTHENAETKPIPGLNSHPVFTCSKLTIEILEQGVIYV